ncbi:MAG: flagellar filament capping protein FliD [Nitrospirae bacterium]|nr:flagellar filament capping protein FliD [Nitrospirota bacterium]
MPISANGVASGLDVNSIVGKLVALERRPIENSQGEQTAFKVRLSAFAGLRSTLSSFKSVLDSLKSLSTFLSQSATSGNEAIVKASASASAVAGTYLVEVKQLAQAQKLSSSGYATSNATAVGTGQLTITVGTGSAVAVSINSTNNTLEGIRDAINAAKADVSASILNDGTNYRLVLTAKNTGQANTIKVTAADNDGNNTDTLGLSNLAYDTGAMNLTQTQAAQNATLKVDGIDNISKSSNTVTDVISGVTLTLVSAAVGTTVSIKVSDDTATVKKSIESFVGEYNKAIRELNKLQSYNPDTKSAGTLLGDATVRSLVEKLQSLVGRSVPGLSGSSSSLAGIGVTTQKDGTLSINAVKLDTALATSTTDVGKIFAFAGTATDPLVTVDSTTAKTKPGTYGVAVTQAATQATLSGSLRIQASGLAAAETVTLAIGADSVVVSLAAGDKIADVVSKINAALQTKAMRMTAVNDNGALKLVSVEYGSAQTITAVSSQAGTNNGDGTGTQTMIGTTLLSNAGVDVAGSINNHVGAGKGQALTGAAGFDEEGVNLVVGGTSIGARGTVTVSFGVADRLSSIVSTYVDTVKGPIAAKEKGLQSSIDEIDKRIARLEGRVASFEKRTREKFNTLESILGRLQGTGSALTQQLNQLDNLSTYLSGRRG